MPDGPAKMQEARVKIRGAPARTLESPARIREVRKRPEATPRPGALLRILRPLEDTLMPATKAPFARAPLAATIMAEM
jgi:hypothetical protein